MRSMFLVPAAGILLVASAPTVAATKQTTMGVSATVAANCVIAAEPLSFGSYDASVDKSGSSDLTVRCSNGTPYTVKLSPGATGSFSQRLLTSGSNSLEYNLYTTSAFSSVWGDGTSGTATQGGFGAGLAVGSAITHTVHGLLPNTDNNQNAPTGNYSDTITVTVEY